MRKKDNTGTICEKKKKKREEILLEHLRILQAYECTEHEALSVDRLA